MNNMEKRLIELINKHGTEIDKLKEENARLREALELILKIGEYSSCEVAYTALEGE